MVGLVWIGDGDGNNNAASLQREGVSESGGYYVERSLLRYTHGAFPEAVDAVPLPALPLPSRGRGQVAAADEFAVDELDASASTVSNARGDSELAVGTGQTVPVYLGDGGSGGFVNVRAQFFEGYRWDVATAERIVWCESSFDPLAISWMGESFGLFQIHAVHAYRWPTFWSEWMIPEVNTAWAYELYLEQGWAIWDCW